MQYVCDICLIKKVYYCDDCYDNICSDVFKLISYREKVKKKQAIRDKKSQEYYQQVIQIEKPRIEYEQLLAYIDMVKQEISKLETKKEIKPKKIINYVYIPKEYIEYQHKIVYSNLSSKIVEILKFYKLKYDVLGKIQIINVFLPQDIDPTNIIIQVACGHLIKLLMILSDLLDIFIPHKLHYENIDSHINNIMINTPEGIELLKTVIVNFNYSIYCQYLPDSKPIKEYDSKIKLFNYVLFLKRNLLLLKNILLE
jgi:hypothetical protein